MSGELFILDNFVLAVCARLFNTLVSYRLLFLNGATLCEKGLSSES